MSDEVHPGVSMNAASGPNKDGNVPVPHAQHTWSEWLAWGKEGKPPKHHIYRYCLIKWCGEFEKKQAASG